ncbi:MAG: UDP-N-acetylmuramoyl-tripeptide--D-alanyl-D-alanine ligase [Rhodospirillaceae bacterium]
MMTLAEAARALAAQLDGTDGPFDGVSTDTRTIRRGQLFVALHGERFDGHRFLADAAAAGAAGAIVARERLLAAADRSAWASLPLIIVSDTRIALGKLAAHWRGRHEVPLIALTGSSGKTTVKEMLACVLRAAAGASGGAGDEKVLATRGNLNNDIGVPLMLLELKPEHRYAVIEMGMNHAGEIRYLAQLATPDVALVTNAGRAHIEYLGSEEAIARAKGEIYEDLKEDATAVINADDAYAQMWRDLAGGRKTIEFGVNARDVSATYRLHPLTSDITLRMRNGDAQVRLGAPGLHNVRNALAAAAVGVALDIAPAVIAAGLETFAGVKGRLQRKSGPRGAVIIDDTYNANPDSVHAAIDVLAALPGKRILVLGDMGELGGHSAQLHSEVGAYARSAGIDELFLLGDLSVNAARAYGEGAHHCADADALVAAAASKLGRDVTVLVKGSRFMRMERVVEALTRTDKQP